MQRFYSVQPGDTIFNLARRWGLTMQSLIAANNLADPSVIVQGQQLAVPPTIQEVPTL
ncbi:MAG TPA: LysM domain-containing protein, partial [Bacillota bacterium]|nr:LysM domain-containing protein [Bacillota bacterium]